MNTSYRNAGVGTIIHLLHIHKLSDQRCVLMKVLLVVFLPFCCTEWDLLDTEWISPQEIAQMLRCEGTIHLGCEHLVLPSVKQKPWILHSLQRCVVSYVDSHILEPILPLSGKKALRCCMSQGCWFNSSDQIQMSGRFIWFAVGCIQRRHRAPSFTASVCCSTAKAKLLESLKVFESRLAKQFFSFELSGLLNLLRQSWS